jgi:hypothetical protein
VKKYIIAICVVLVGIIACTAFLITDAKPRAPDSTEYTVYVYPDGLAEIEVQSVNQIQQLHKKIVVDDMILLPGTLILPGNGNTGGFEYPQKRRVLD